VAFPEPEPGLVIQYAYLWRTEADEGRESGAKDRPCAVVVAVKRNTGAITVVVAPVKHRKPRDMETALEIPLDTKRRLGLDEAESWLIADDLNYFEWPGPDLRPVPGEAGPGRFAYGYLPHRTTTKMIDKVRDLTRKGRIRVSDRSD
jgi:hypothetical protein